MLDWSIAFAAGGGGGVIVEVVVLLHNLEDWRSARRRARLSAESVLPPISDHVDALPDGLSALTRLLLGAVVGALFHTQVTSMWAAVAIGASAPALVRQLGGMRSLQEAVGGDGNTSGESPGAKP